MKNKQLAVLMGILVTVSCVSVNVSASAVSDASSASDTVSVSEASSASAEDSNNSIWGEVVSIGDSQITIAVGTPKEMKQKGDDADESGSDAPAAPDDSEPSMLELTGEEMTISVTDSTVITRTGMGGGQAPEQPATPSDNMSEQPDTNNGEPPALPENEENESPELSENGSGAFPGGNEEIALSDITEGDTICITLDEEGNALTISVQSAEMGIPGASNAPGGGPDGGVAPGGPGQAVDSYTSVNEYTEDTVIEDAALESTGTDENAVLISSDANVTISASDITRTSQDSTGGDNSSFYGVGAALLATEGSAFIKDSTITTDAAGGAGLFAYGDGTIYAADSDITTQQDTSGGIHAAGGGTVYAWDLSVETNGESAAAIRSDRGGGTMVVDGGTYTSNGTGSPAVYCTADIAVNNAELTATGSEAVCIEGLNSLHLYDCTLSGNMNDLDQNDCTWTVILYQSMSGDSEIGNSTFQMSGGNLISQNGGLFYTTNTECTFTLENVNISYNDDSEFFLQCTGNNNQRGWGQAGSNGSDCHFTAINQEMQGDIIWDSISNLDFYITENSTLAGAFVNDETYAGNGGDGYCNVYVDSDSSWTVTGDSTISSLSNEGTIQDPQGNTVTVVGTDGTVYVEGDSPYTVTVDSYQDSADLSDCTSMAQWDSFAVTRPEEL